MPIAGPELELLVLQAQGGDPVAFGRLVEVCHPVLLRHAGRHLRDRDLARDATQDAWHAIVRSLRQLDDPARFVAWALAITARRAIDVGRRRGRSAGLAPGDEIPDVAAPLAAAAEDDHDRLRRAVARLDFAHRVVVELHYREGLSVAEVAAVVGVPAGTVKTRLFHARRRLRAGLGTSADHAIHTNDTE